MVRALPLLFLVACTGTPVVPDSFCEDESRGEALFAGYSRLGEQGVWTFELLDADPLPAEIPFNAWTVRITDVDGTPVSGLAVTVSHNMPDHGHDGVVEPDVVDNGDGTYSFEELHLFMGGYWEVILLAEQTEGAADSVLIGFCVEP